MVLAIDTKQSGDIENIPLLTVNVDAISMEAIFWIEETAQPPSSASIKP